MPEKLLKVLQQTEGEIVMKANGDILIAVGDEQHLVGQVDHWEQAYTFAKGVQIALSYFINYRPEIKVEA